MADRLRTLPETLAWRAGASPDRVFLQTTDGATVTYREQHEAALTVAGALQEVGVKAADRVVSLQNLHPVAFANWLGIAYLRAWDVPVHTGARGDALSYAIHNVEAETVVADSDFLPQLAEIAHELPQVRLVLVTDDGPIPDMPFEVVRQSELTGAKPLEDPDPPKPWDVATVVHSSGTTGPAKAIIVPWGSLDVQAVRMWPMEDLTEDDVFYTYAPTYYTASKCFPEMMAILGARCLLQPRLRIETFWDDVRKYGITTSIVYREQAEFLLRQPEAPQDGQTSLRNVMMIPVSPLHREFRERFGVRVCTGYGLSEVGNITTSAGWNTDNWASVGKVTAGAPGWQHRVVDAFDYEVAPGEVGELVVRADEPWSVSLGYYKMPEKTAAAWRNGWFHTGDAVREEPDGAIHWVDRFSDLLHRRGVAIASYEIERYLLAHAEVSECAAVSDNTGPSDEDIRVFVVRTPDATISIEDLRAFAESSMPGELVPEHFEFIDTLPRTQASNRIQKAALRARAAGRV
ncbi:AMP-binding protein [Streptomyces sp. NPDC001276]|uniref:AMP-binding protein n=1 Tax=Streptomyces sp. NPDC001276 TaxID=3364555 RepID=UPI003698A465